MGMFGKFLSALIFGKKFLFMISDSIFRSVKKITPHKVKDRIKNIFMKKQPDSQGDSSAQLIDVPIDHQHKMFYKKLISYNRYEAIWHSKFGELENNCRGYFELHKKRFFELLNTMNYFVSSIDNPMVLEIGPSDFSPIYKEITPKINLVTLDRPVEENGFDFKKCTQLYGAERHYNFDLNTYNLSPSSGSPTLGTFDYILCTEVLEHLVVNPVEFLSSLLSLLKDEGRLYLTTPNFFRHENLGKMSRRENPQMVYPAKGLNWDAHHHFREYDMRELKEFCVEAGASKIYDSYSDCWDPEDRDIPYNERANLILVVQK